MTSENVPSPEIFASWTLLLVLTSLIRTVELTATVFFKTIIVGRVIILQVLQVRAGRSQKYAMISTSLYADVTAKLILISVLHSRQELALVTLENATRNKKEHKP